MQVSRLVYPNTHGLATLASLSSPLPDHSSSLIPTKKFAAYVIGGVIALYLRRRHLTLVLRSASCCFGGVTSSLWFSPPPTYPGSSVASYFSNLRNSGGGLRLARLWRCFRHAHHVGLHHALQVSKRLEKDMDSRDFRCLVRLALTWRGVVYGFCENRRKTHPRCQPFALRQQLLSITRKAVR